MRHCVMKLIELLERKQCAGEAEYGPRRPLLHAFIRAELEEERFHRRYRIAGKAMSGELDRLLYETVMR